MALHRPLINVERTLWRIDDLCRFNWLVAARVHGALRESSVRGALDLLQRRHPLLRAHIEASPEPVFVTDGTPPIPLRILERKNETEWHRVVEEEINAPLPWREGPMVRVTVLASPGASDVVVAFHHAMADGLSGAIFLRELFEAVDTLDRGMIPEDRPRAMHPGLEAALPSKHRKLGLRWRTTRRLAKQIAAGFVAPPRKLPADRHAPMEERVTKVIHRWLDPDTAGTLLERCRAEKCSVHGALCAAMLQSVAAQLRGSTGKEETVKLCCASPINLRPALEPPATDDMGLFLGAAFTLHRMASNTDPWDVARAISQRLVEERESGEACRSVVQRSALSLRMFSARTLIRELNRPMWGAIGVTNLGSLDLPRRYARFSVDGLEFFCPAAPYGTSVYLVITTFQGRMALNFGYTQPLVSELRARAIAEDVVARLRSLASLSDVDGLRAESTR